MPIKVLRPLSNLWHHSSFSSDKFVKIVEVGPRDGLQNEKTIIPLEVKVELINKLSSTGLLAIEAGSFVSPRLVPQMADSENVLKSINKNPKVSYPVLVPNRKYFDRAVEAGAKEIAIFGSASEAFSQKNINCSISESLKRFEEVARLAQEMNIPMRGYVSCVVGCPYEGKVDPKVAQYVSKVLVDMGCYEISLGDTIGVGTPKSITEMVNIVLKALPIEKLAMHCHDTYGQAIANIRASLDCGIRVFDSSISGLGGCPFAKGATGNVATEDVLYLLSREGYTTDVDIMDTCRIGEWISGKLGRQNHSRAGKALLAKIKSSGAPSWPLDKGAI
ncbi:hypothetical protein H4219_000388 [Mycoemilia scoparia]|uniref:hydroxymethylglutaryl-CoA lyase n=1 Tax=Mycoemilia scoparia TaxID=417184 RepID=A0A9W8A7E5_9FUNG|nr:hypothetical protein H4219_000388 [Mycoemilia scoparia]